MPKIKKESPFPPDPQIASADCGLLKQQVLIQGYKPITTQIFDKDSKYLDDDSVFAVKDSLIVEFVPRKGDSQANFELKYDILMAPIDSKGESGPENGLSTVGQPQY